MSKRNINIELIRVLSMLMIVYHHFSIHSDWPLPNELGIRKYLILSTENFGKIGVLLFVLITGFFYRKQNFSFKRIIKLNNTVTMYTLSIFLISLFWSNFSIKSLIQSAFPIIFEQYWFITGYVILLLVQPLFKDYLNNTNKKDKLKFLLVLICFFYGPGILGIIFQIKSYFTPDIYFIFIIVVLLGDLINEYQNELKNNYYKYITLGLIASLFLLQTRPFIINFLDSHKLNYPSYLINGTESLTSLIFSFSFFITLLKVKINPNFFSTITFLSVSTFDVYLLHDNRILRPLLWNVIFKNPDFYWSNLLFPIIILEPLLIFIICIFISKIMNFIVPKTFNLFSTKKT